MSTETPRGGTPKKRPSLWQADLSSLGKKSDADEAPEHLPFVPSLPSVNLLPRSVRDSILTAKIRRVVAWVLLLVVVVSAGSWYLQTDQITRSENAVSIATARNEQLRSELAAMTPVRRMYEQITRLQGIVTDTLAGQPEAAAVNRRLIAAGELVAGGDITFSSIEVIYSGIPVVGEALNPCPNPDPFSDEIAIGCVTFSASVANREQVSALLRALGTDPMFVGPYVTTTNVSTIEGVGDVVSFTGSAGVSTAGLVTPLTPEEIDAIVNPPKEESSTTTGEDAGATDGQAAETAPTGEAS